MKPDVIILACGPNNNLLSQINLAYPPENILSCVQYEYPSESGDFVELYFSRQIAPNFFAWKIPTDSSVRVGLGVRAKEPAVFYLSRFLRKLNITNKPTSKTAGIIPIKGPLKKIQVENILVVGDAAGHVKPTTGGGVITGITAARIAGRVAMDGNLDDYQRLVDSSLKKEFDLGLVIRQVLDSLSVEQLDKLFSIITENNLQKLLSKYGDMDKPTSLLKLVEENPKAISQLFSVIG